MQSLQASQCLGLPTFHYAPSSAKEVQTPRMSDQVIAFAMNQEVLGQKWPILSASSSKRVAMDCSSPPM
jgi:hypothetical protein